MNKRMSNNILNQYVWSRKIAVESQDDGPILLIANSPGFPCLPQAWLICFYVDKGFHYFNIWHKCKILFNRIMPENNFAITYSACKQFMGNSVQHLASTINNEIRGGLQDQLYSNTKWLFLFRLMGETSIKLEKESALKHLVLLIKVNRPAILGNQNMRNIREKMKGKQPKKKCQQHTIKQY